MRKGWSIGCFKKKLAGYQAGLRPHERVRAILRYLLSKESRCAGFQDILNALRDLNRRAGVKDPKKSTLMTLISMRRAGLIRRSWITIEGRKKRIYCLARSD